MTHRWFSLSLNSLMLISLMLMVLGGCARPAQPPKTLTVFAAASLTESFTEIGKQF
jgi:molybdate transport system substrate-binding protein